MRIRYGISVTPYRRHHSVKADHGLMSSSVSRRKSLHDLPAEIRSRIYDFCVGDMIAWQKVAVLVCAVDSKPPCGQSQVYRFRQIQILDPFIIYIVDERMRLIHALMSTSCLIRDDLLPRYYRNHMFFTFDSSRNLMQPFRLVEAFHEIMPLTTKLSVAGMHVQMEAWEVAPSLQHLDRIFAGFDLLESMTFDYPRSLTMSQDAPEQWSRQTLVWLQALHKSCPRLLHAYYRKSDAITTQLLLTRSDSEGDGYSKLHINTELSSNFKARMKRPASKFV